MEWESDAMKAIIKTTLFVYHILPDWEVNTMASITKRSGSWQYRVSYKDHDGNRRYVNKSGFQTKKAAALAAADVEQQHNRGDDLSLRDVNFLEYYDSWMQIYKVGHVALGTLANYEVTQHHLHSYFPRDQLLRTMSASKWQDFLNWLGQGRTKSTVRKIQTCVRGMIKSAIDDGVITRDFTRRTEISGGDSKPSSLKYLEASDFKKLLEFCSAHASMSKMYNYIILTGALTGARFSEVVALTWDDVDFRQQTIFIHHGWDYRNHTGLTRTKNSASVRTISIPPSLVSALKNLHADQQAYYMETGYRDSLNMVFRNAKHQVAGNRSINDDLKNVLKASHINKAITFHALRHTHVSYLLAQGVALEYISKRLGHSSLAITMQVYTHLLHTAEKKQEGLANTALERLQR